MATPERIREIIEFVTVDAYTDDEVMSGWGVAFDDAVSYPVDARALGKPIHILGFEADLHRGVRCEIEGDGVPRRWVGIDALDEESLPEPIRDVLEAFDSWG